MSRIGVMAADKGDARQASAAFERALPIFHALRDRVSAAQIIFHVARLALLAGRPNEAVQLLAAADAFYVIEGMRLTANEHAGRNALLAQARGDLGEDAYADAFAFGQAVSIDDAIMHAHALMRGESMPGDLPVAGPSLDALGLTQREREVLRMLALGLTDREIADRLSLSPRTVGGHVTHLLGKLGVESRTAAAIHAIRYGLD